MVFDLDNPTYTSARRLARGFFYSMVVSLGFGYVVGYLLNRLARQPLVGAAPAFRATEPYGRVGLADVSGWGSAPKLSQVGPHHRR